MTAPTRVLAVCLGNICRSPVAEAALREAADAAGLDVEVDSAGTGAWHVGNPPDARMRAAGRAAGLVVEGSARKVIVRDLRDFDLVLAMDAANLADLQRMAADTDAAATIRLFRSFDPDLDAVADDLDVPDPYYGGEDGFRDVVAMVRPAAVGVMDWVRTRADGR